MIDISELITDADFAQSFTLYRVTGSYVNGLFTTNEATLTRYGIIQPLTSKDIKEMPGGDAITGGIKVWTQEPLYTTSINRQGLSDEITWQSQRWKILQVRQWVDNGYYMAVCVQLEGG